MKTIFVLTIIASLILSGCNNEEPKKPSAKETTSPAIQATADKAHEVIDKTATASQTLAEKAVKIKDIAWKAVTDMLATVQNKNEQITEEATKNQTAPTPADAKK
ncbi:MAG: hypothetical protein NTY00_08860 [Deltaproteobacteria bacterium]|nr:hypothetical protein [Deltaproteobacteria bacterium]